MITTEMMITHEKKKGKNITLFSLSPDPHHF